MPRTKKNVVQQVESSPQVEEKIIVKTEEEKKPEIIVVSQPSEKDRAKAKLAKLIEEETKTVKGKFRNHECPGASLRVQIRKYPGIPFYDRELEDGKMYEVPLYVARHLNGVDVSSGGATPKINTCAWPTHGFTWANEQSAPPSHSDDQGVPVPIIGVTKWNKRFSFDSLEFDVAM